MKEQRPSLPPPSKLPEPVRRTRRTDDDIADFSVLLETTTPILGGAPRTREPDLTDIIRVPTIRGHLRFWWRATQTAIPAEPREFFAREAALWGRAAETNTGGRSAVEITVAVRPHALFDPEEPVIGTPTGYALWPARKTESLPVARRRRAGVRFVLTVRAPRQHLPALRLAVQTWLLFGGYGSRARRGLGSLTIRQDNTIRCDPAAWLPSVYDDDDDAPKDELRDEMRDALARVCSPALFAPAGSPVDFPRLAGAALLLGRNHKNPDDAWREAIGWLQTFRQGRGFAREPGTGRPGVSRWPEADKLRHLGYRDGHTPRFDNQPAWPRAAFGLPIVGQFTPRRDPFEIAWKLGPNIMDRLGSPLIVKALATKEGFRPCALWLERPAPRGGQVVARDARARNKPELAGSAAPFDFVGSAADQTLAARLPAPLGRHRNVRSAFTAWLAAKDGVVQVAP